MCPDLPVGLHKNRATWRLRVWKPLRCSMHILQINDRQTFHAGVRWFKFRLVVSPMRKQEPAALGNDVATVLHVVP
ncbi:hypothetical protein K239x_04850 [Planctomycetes bacterium K23_9]|uniref:Uncharacterized protein n=1 Tax=Stieleria marina TaxID=1930275 RepID=A0A517NN46_9BACT|nr:hypothetical protein K239x_04850 [Planctomycetes bacterium K23_9]